MASTVVKLFADSSVSPLLLLATVGAVVVLFCWKWLFVSAGDSQEPPEIKSMIPFVGHLLGLIWYQSEYLVMLRLVFLWISSYHLVPKPLAQHRNSGVLLWLCLGAFGREETMNLSTSWIQHLLDLLENLIAARVQDISTHILHLTQ